LLSLALLTFTPVAALAETYKPASIAGTQASAQASVDGGGTRVIWRRIVGVVVPDNIVGEPPESGDCDKTCAVSAPVPWTATGGRAEVDLGNGEITFTVHGLVVAEAFGCCTMGTPTIITKVKGTLVCNDTAPGLAKHVDTKAVRIRNSGFATFSGRVDLPASCSDEPDDIAFVIRIADLSISDEFQELIGMWNAFGADRVIRRPER
jgi:hypothetical protein